MSAILRGTLRVLPKVPFGSPYRGVRVHRIKAIAGELENGRVVYSAQWLCGNPSPNVILMADPGERLTCATCEEMASPYLYRCFADDGNLLYIGSAQTLRARIKLHEKKSPWWHKVAKVTHERFSSIIQARTAELLAIQAENPAHNRQLKKRRSEAA